MAADNAMDMMKSEIDEVQSGQNEADDFQLTQAEIDAIKKIFSQFDTDNSNTIEKKELESLCIALNDPLTKAELTDFFKRIDDNNNGKISWDEFIDYWGNN
jgi:calmodulin